MRSIMYNFDGVNYEGRRVHSEEKKCENKRFSQKLSKETSSCKATIQCDASASHIDRNALNIGNN